jgi:uncharacterized protein
MFAHFILYVSDQSRSTRFYASTLGFPPILDVPGMTEFHLSETAILGLMPESGARRLFGADFPDPANASGIPRSELYLRVEDPAACHRRALEAGARELSPLLPRDWGHTVAYSLDPDGHVLAIAQRAD